MLYGLWADSVDAMNEAIQDESRRADANYTSAQEWKAYAKQLEAKLEELAGKYHETRDWYYDMACSEKAQSALKAAALEEIKRLDPTNKLLDQSYRKVIADKVRSEVMAELTKK